MERSFTLGKLKRLSPSQQSQLLPQLQTGDYQPAWQALQHQQPFYQTAVAQLWQLQSHSKELRDDAALTAMLPIQGQLQARMPALMTVATLAPMFGLLGTVVGLMRAFRDIGLHQGPVEPSIVADGLWQALSTTAVGLVIAAFCIVAHALLSSRIRRSLGEAKLILNQFSLALSQAQSKPND
ncbi:MAG: MotA/TolQ/ExbB proton channel family protein [Cellvibrionaceae bacterium]|nr:MotA/TolQ/ExbB proton channel family protein [Cellvibrionaceae bacterium]MCV6624676.1 MotA/TolQ/ExbB proton channel family protein [Cellvibrionaceae bacterium]